jgi:hypothetical protein
MDSRMKQNSFDSDTGGAYPVAPMGNFTSIPQTWNFFVRQFVIEHERDFSLYFDF